MSDLIDRQAAIDALAELPYGIRGMVKGIIAYVPSARPEQLDTCPIYDGMCGYPSDRCYECPRHGGAKEKAMWWTLPSAQPEQRWIPCSERLPEEDHWLGGSGKQFSDQVLVTIINHSDDDVWVDMTYTIDGEWMIELPRHCKIVAWMPLPPVYREEGD